MQEINIRAAEPPRRKTNGKWMLTLERFLDSGLEAAEVFAGRNFSKYEATLACAGLRSAVKRKGLAVSVQKRGTEVYLIRAHSDSEFQHKAPAPSQEAGTAYIQTFDVTWERLKSAIIAKQEEAARE